MAGPNGQPDFGLVLLSYQQAAVAQNSVTNAASFRVRGRSEFSVTCPPYHQPHNIPSVPLRASMTSNSQMYLPSPDLKSLFFFCGKSPVLLLKFQEESWLNHMKSLGRFNSQVYWLPSGNLLHNYGKSPFLMGKSTINGHFQ
jgi:hypothetical protein